MRISNDFQRYEAARQIYSVLVMHFQEGITQAEIAKLTKLSHAKVNRLIKQGREMGMVEITIHSPYQALFDLEARFREATGLETVRITPTASPNPHTILHQVGAPRRTCCSRRLQDGDTVCITGGKGVSAVVEMLNPERRSRSRSCRRPAASRASTIPTSTTSRPRWPTSSAARPS